MNSPHAHMENIEQMTKSLKKASKPIQKQQNRKNHEWQVLRRLMNENLFLNQLKGLLGMSGSSSFGLIPKLVSVHLLTGCMIRTSVYKNTSAQTSQERTQSFWNSELKQIRTNIATPHW